LLSSKVNQNTLSQFLIYFPSLKKKQTNEVFQYLAQTELENDQLNEFEKFVNQVNPDSEMKYQLNKQERIQILPEIYKENSQLRSVSLFFPQFA
jgi:hypothetical protein